MYFYSCSSISIKTLQSSLGFLTLAKIVISSVKEKQNMQKIFLKNTQILSIQFLFFCMISFSYLGDRQSPKRLRFVNLFVKVSRVCVGAILMYVLCMYLCSMYTRGYQMCFFVLQSSLNCLNLEWELVKVRFTQKMPFM